MFKSNTLAKRIFAAALSAAILFSVALTGCSNDNGDSSNTSTDSNVSGTASAATVDDVPDAIRSEHYQISLAFISYMFNDIYNTYSSTWEYYYGFDPTVSLKDQYTPESDSTQTWFDYLLTLVEEQVRQVLIFAEAGLAEGLTLTEDEQNSITTQIESLSSEAEASGMSMEEYIVEQCGPGVTEADLKNYSEILILAQKYYQELSDSFTYEDADYDTYYQENRESFLYCDYLSYSFTSALGDDATDEEVEADKSARKALADELAECTTQEEFESYVRAYLQANPSLVVSSTTTSDGETSEPTQEEIDAAIETKISGMMVEKYAYEISSTGGQWLFDDERQNGDITVFEGDTSYTVALMLKSAYRDESVGRNVRHILIRVASESSDGSESSGLSDTDARAKAEEIYQEWQNGEKTEDSFAILATMYSEDTGSVSNGGLYENIAEGDMVTEFNDWCFDESRQPGDTDIVQTSHGYHIMYFVGNSMPAWKVTADTAMRSNDAYEAYQKMVDEYTITFDDEALDSLTIFS